MDRLEYYRLATTPQNIVSCPKSIMENGVFLDDYVHQSIISTTGEWHISDNALRNDFHMAENEGCYISPIIESHELRQRGLTKLCVNVAGIGCGVYGREYGWTHASVGISYKLPGDRHSRGDKSTSILLNYDPATGKGNGVFDKTKFVLNLGLARKKDMYIMFHAYYAQIAIYDMWFE